jgi:hypothetical protein
MQKTRLNRVGFDYSSVGTKFNHFFRFPFWAFASGGRAPWGER